MKHDSPMALMAACGLLTVATAQDATSSAAQTRELTASPVVRDLKVAVADAHRVHFEISWPNSWRNQRNHDAAWIILRGPHASEGPLLLAKHGHSATAANGSAAALQVAVDGTGVFVAPATNHRGDAAFHVSLQLLNVAPKNVQAWSIGMVYIPAGGFDLGDDDAMSLKFGAFHGLSNDKGDALRPHLFGVHDERAIEIAEQPGALWYATDRNKYRGDQAGPIPAAWPKGTQAFYLMKHELRQGDYARFLSALPREWQDVRAPLALTDKEAASCTIVRDGARFVASAPDRPCNFVSWDDTCAWMDWLALRPMTEFEFEKAARGPHRPVAGDYPWGTNSDTNLQRTVTSSRDLTKGTPADEGELSEQTKAQLGASFYWVMDLSGSLWERCISAGHHEGRKFVGSHGDGVLSQNGTATNTDWPKSEGGEAPGMGYRGGAEYFSPRKVDDLTNPNSPVAFRTYAGWGGSQRYKTYSARGCRSATVGTHVMDVAARRH